MERKIDFMCVGVQKAGTTTLHDILNQHPDLCLPLKKETHFFSNSELFRKGLDHYFDNYFEKAEHQLYGEIDPEYSYENSAAERIYNSFGQIKILFILRNPIDRAYSQYLMTKRRGLEELSFMDALREEKERLSDGESRFHHSYLSRGYYSGQLANYEKYFEAHNIKVILFEEFIKNTEKHVQQISNFIALPKFQFITDRVSNPASEPRIKGIQKFIYSKSKFKNLIGKLIVSKDIKRKMMQAVERQNLKKIDKEELPEEIRKSVYEEYYHSEIEELERKLKLDLSIWKP